MFLDSIMTALNGPSLAKFAVAALSLVLFLSLRGKDAEGLLSRLAFFSAILLARDLAFVLLPSADLYRLSDLVVFCLLAWLVTAPRGGWALWASIAANAAVMALMIVKLAFGIAPGLPTELARYFAMAPILLIVVRNVSREGEAEPARKAISGMALPIAIVSFCYLVGGSILGTGSFWFHAFIVPVFYGFILWVAVRFMGIAENQLVSAVSYYEESVDSLYELLLPSGQGSSGGVAMQESLDNMARVISERTGAESAAILLIEEFDEAITVRSIHGRFAPPFKLPDTIPRTEDRVNSFLRHARFRLGEGLLGEAAKAGNPLLVAEAALDSRVARNGDEDWLQISSLMVVPLVVRDRIIGVIALERSAGVPFSESDFDRAKLLSNFGSIAIANSFSFLEAAERSDIEREAAIAEGIQKTIVPAKIQPLGAYSIGALTVPARGVCSDYYDVIRLRQDKAVLAVGDVAGKGVAAGLVMVMVSSILRLITNSTKDMATLMAWVNRGIAGQVDLDHFATLGLVCVDAASGVLEFSNAAHQPLLIYRVDSDAVETVDIKSIPIGVERTTAYQDKKVRLAPGDVLVMHTDGLVEAMNDQGKQFGRKNLAQSVHRHHGLVAKEMAEAILADVQEFSGRTRQHDDQTILVMKSKP